MTNDNITPFWDPICYLTPSVCALSVTVIKITAYRKGAHLTEHTYSAPHFVVWLCSAQLMQNRKEINERRYIVIIIILLVVILLQSS